MNDYRTYARACRAACVDPIEFEASTVPTMPEDIRHFFEECGTTPQQNRYYSWLILQLSPVPDGPLED